MSLKHADKVATFFATDGTPYGTVWLSSRCSQTRSKSSFAQSAGLESDHTFTSLSPSDFSRVRVWVRVPRCKSESHTTSPSPSPSRHKPDSSPTRVRTRTCDYSTLPRCVVGTCVAAVHCLTRFGMLFCCTSVCILCAVMNRRCDLQFVLEL